MSDSVSANGFDVAVIGSGIGGMTAAALLARAGKRVFVAEQAAAPGGYAHAFQRGPYTIDPAVHSIGDPGLFDALLRYLGVRDQCRFLPLDRFYNVFARGEIFRVPLTTPEEFVARHVEWFPHEAKGVRDFFGLCEQIHRDAHELPQQLAIRDLDRVVERFPVLFQYRNARLGEVLAEQIGDPRARSVCGSLSALLGLPASRTPLQGFAQLLFSYLVEGSFYCQGGAQKIIDALVIALERDGGELSLNSRVRRILVRDGRAAGLVLESGSEIEASILISNAAAWQTFEELVGAEHLPEPFLRRLRSMRPSISGFLVYGASTQDLAAHGADHMVFYMDSWDLDQSYQESLTGQKIGGMGIFVPTLVDPTLAPPGEHIITCLLFAPYEIGVPWSEARERYQELVLDEMETAFPGFRHHLLFVDCATPLTLERYTLNTCGAIYGWENVPEFSGSRRPAHQTPLPGLYLSGHWTQPGAGWLRAAVSGIHTARLVLRDTGAGNAPAFEYSRLPRP